MVPAACEWGIEQTLGSMGVGTGVMWIIGPWITES